MSNVIENIKKIKEAFESKKISLLGNIHTVSYSHIGECLALHFSGDVPMAMKPGEIVIVHPKARHAGWVGIGNIALNTFIHGSAGIEKVPLCDEAIEMLKEIYRLYTNEEFKGSFYRQNNINKMTFGSTLEAIA